MARFITGNSFGATDAVTSATLNNAVNNAKISTDSVDGATIEISSDALRIKDGGVGFAKLTDVIDSDTMSGATNTKLATAESIKAYVDTNSGLKASTATGTLSVSNNNAFAQTDLSSVVGSNKAMVIMEISNSSRLSDWIFRTPGSTVNALSGHSGANSVQSSTGSAPLTGGTIVVITNSSGVIEYRAISASGTTTASYSIQAFQKIT
tara:strand:+ start:15 stop:638 length:624 start_codon:yes stop_codon:yes gene_type:complete